MSKEKKKVKVKKKSILTPVTIAVVSLGAFVMMISIGITPQLMGNSVTNSSKYIIEYNSNGGKGSMSNQTIKVGDSIKLRKNTFKLEGYKFNGWRAKRSSNKWLCYVDQEKVYNEWTDIRYCNMYGYSLIDDQVYVKDIASSGDTLTLYADWIESN